MRTGVAMEVEEPATGLDADGSWLSVKFTLLDPDGKPYALGGISTDITDRKRAEAAAREARDEAERANEAKSEFLSRMSHELRTPLNAILGFGQLLVLDGLEEEAQARVERILRAGHHLLELINEVLDITRIEAGGQALSLEPVHCCDPLVDALELVRPLAIERGIELASDMHGGLHRYVLADSQRLKQVALNLLSNAIKYNRPGGVVRTYFDETVARPPAAARRRHGPRARQRAGRARVPAVRAPGGRLHRDRGHRPRAHALAQPRAGHGRLGRHRAHRAR